MAISTWVGSGKPDLLHRARAQRRTMLIQGHHQAFAAQSGQLQVAGTGQTLLRVAVEPFLGDQFANADLDTVAQLLHFL